MSAKETAPGKLAPGTARRGALKRLDGEPLTRQDLQYDLLSYIFNDDHAVFTDPFSNPPGNQVTFRDLYVSAILRAPKTARSVRDKIGESDAFATDFAMLSLLANVGRVNTSMAFFPETRTALRTYHPVPALQRSDGNLTDAPRIRNALKSVILPGESKHVPNSPFTILAQRETGPIPTTSVVNLLFVFTQHSTNIGNSHFAHDLNLEFTDLFQPVPIPSAERGRAFLWLVFHYLESSDSPNPFADPKSTSTNPKYEKQTHVNPNAAAPRMRRVDPKELASENIDTQVEIGYGERMRETRRMFLAADKERQEAVSALQDQARGGSRGAGAAEREASGTPAPSATPSEVATTSAAKSIKPKGRGGRKAADFRDGYTKFRYEHTEPNHSFQLQPDGVLPLGPTSRSNTATSHHRNYHRHQDQEPVIIPVENIGRGRKPRRGHGAGAGAGAAGYRTEPCEFVHSPERTMFEQAWHLISTRDVLYDSDEPDGDEHVRLDLTRRLQTLNRLRGRSPSPELKPGPEELHPDVEREQMHNGIEIEHQPQIVPVAMDVDDRW